VQAAITRRTEYITKHAADERRAMDKAWQASHIAWLQSNAAVFVEKTYAATKKAMAPELKVALEALR
jgi:hypothetical protein